MIHHNTLLTSTGRFISIPVSARTEYQKDTSQLRCSTPTSSTGNGHLPPFFALWVPLETSASSGSPLTGTGNCFHPTTGRDLGRHRMFAPGRFSKALSRNHYQKFLFLALSSFCNLCFLLTSVLLHSPGSEGLPFALWLSRASLKAHAAGQLSK